MKNIGLSRQHRSSSPLETRFILLWLLAMGPKLEKEFRFDPDRKWRADFCHQASKTLVEIEGGIWSGGRHTRGSGFISDCQKYNRATELGYRVFRLTDSMINETQVRRLIEICKGEK